jgi:hypothetical protein
MQDTTDTKRGRGRPKGQSSFVRINIAQLAAALPNGSLVPVSSVWLREVGLTVEESKPLTVYHSPVFDVEEKIEFAVEEYVDSD